MRRICCLAYLTLHACAAWSDGAFIAPVITDRISGAAGVASAEQKGIIVELPESREALLLQTTYHGPAYEFAWVVPVPRRPGPDDVFLASTAFIDELLESTRPEVETSIHAPPAPAKLTYPTMEVGEGMEAAEEGGEATVTVHERMEIGDFDVAVLSATGPAVLANWLTGNGFRIPDGTDPIFDHYVAKQWYFVALRIQPSKVEQRSILKDVDPIGIRFDTEELVYPLYISRASSRQKTAMLLLVLSDSPVACDQLPEAQLPIDARLGQGTCYATVRREAVERQSPSAVCEFRAPPLAELPRHFESEEFTTPSSGQWRLGALWVTRLWTILDREDMADLTFTDAVDQQAMRLAVIREGWIYSPPPSLFHRISAFITAPRLWRGSSAEAFPWIYGMAGALLFICTLRAAERGLRPKARYSGWLVAIALMAVAPLVGADPRVFLGLVVLSCTLGVSVIAGGLREPGRRPRLSGDAVAKGVAIAAGLAVFGRFAYCTAVFGTDFLRRASDGEHVVAYWAGAGPLHYLVVAILLEIIWIALVVDFVSPGLAGAAERRAWLVLPLFCIGFVLLVALRGGTLLTAIAEEFTHFHPPGRWQSGPLTPILAVVSLLTLGALCFLLAFITTAWCIGEPARRAAAPMARVLVGLVLVAVLFSVLGMASVRAGEGGYLPSGLGKLDRALEHLDFMLTTFQDRYGCNPAALADMTLSEVPAEGLDSSGNMVALEAPPFVGPPNDPPYDHPVGFERPFNELPVDPLTGRNDTWLYEPTGSPMIDSGGYAIQIVQRPLPQR